jgi:hypothetical protein
MLLATILKELNEITEVQIKRARLETAGFQPPIANRAAAPWLGAAIATASLLVQIPESDAGEFLNPFAE